MIEIIDGNILDCVTKNSIICHQVNCKGVMGAGLAKQIRNKYPRVYEEYRKNHLKYGSKLGDVKLIDIENGNLVANIYGQESYGRDKNRIYTSYNALKEAFETIANFLSMNEEYTLFIPYKIGCGLANGSWGVVVNLINQEFSRFDERVKIIKL